MGQQTPMLCNLFWFYSHPLEYQTPFSQVQGQYKQGSEPSPPGGRDEERAIAPWNNKNGAETIHNNQYYIIWPITNIKYWIWALK